MDYQGNGNCALAIMNDSYYSMSMCTGTGSYMQLDFICVKLSDGPELTCGWKATQVIWHQEHERQ